MKRVCSVLIAVLLIVGTVMCMALPASASSENKVDVRDGVAVVLCMFEVEDYGQLGYYSTGTGFFVGEDSADPQHLITNYHVISDYVKFGSGERVEVDAFDLFNNDKKFESYQGIKVVGRAMLYVYYSSSNEDRVEAYPVDYDRNKDIAIIKLSKATAERRSLPLREPDDSMVGNITVRTVGFPAVADNKELLPTSKWGVSDTTVKTGGIAKILTITGKGEELLMVDCEINSGNSGGPLVNDNGEVLGINTWGYLSVDENEIANLYYSISISEAIPMLKKNNIPYTDATDSASGNADNSKTDETAASTAVSNTDVTEKTDSDTTGGGTMVLIIVGIAALVIVCGMFAFVLIRNKNKAAKEKNQIEEDARQAIESVRNSIPSAPVKVPYVRSMAVQHRGQKVEITSGQIMIGRNKTDCAIVFSASTPGVSGRHCSVSYDAASGDFVLTDLKSTYGTFLQNGQQLAPLVQYRLRSGDRFYLGKEDNMIVVELG